MLLHYQSYGAGNPLIILHGLLGSSNNWHTLGKVFGEQFRVFALDARNHGRSPHAEDFNFTVMADDVREFIEQQNLQSASLLGHSMGGKTAMQLALTYPHLVHKLIVVDIAPKPYPRLHDEIFETLSTTRLEMFNSRKAVDEALAARIPDFAARQFLMKNLSRDDFGKFRWRINLPVIQQNYDAIAAAIESNRTYEKPTLFIRSERSGYIESNDLPAIKKLFPQAQVVGVDVGHWIHAEAPQEFARIVLEFLNS